MKILNRVKSLMSDHQQRSRSISQDEKKCLLYDNFKINLLVKRKDSSSSVGAADTPPTARHHTSNVIELNAGNEIQIESIAAIDSQQQQQQSPKNSNNRDRTSFYNLEGRELFGGGVAHRTHLRTSSSRTQSLVHTSLRRDFDKINYKNNPANKKHSLHLDLHKRHSMNGILSSMTRRMLMGHAGTGAASDVIGQDEAAATNKSSQMRPTTTTNTNKKAVNFELPVIK